MEYYVYVYSSPEGVPYYVGRGLGARAFNRIRHKCPIPPKEQIQFFYFDESWKADECEIDLIYFFKRTIDGGTLLNISTGGPGSPGYTRPHAQRWVVTTPDGHIHHLHGLHLFCREHNINQGRLSELASGKRKYYKGYKCSRQT